jgi:hypothetical protein
MGDQCNRILGDWGLRVQISPLRPRKSLVEIQISEISCGVPVELPHEPA